MPSASFKARNLLPMAYLGLTPGKSQLDAGTHIFYAPT
jgi:hypothetical protein